MLKIRLQRVGKKNSPVFRIVLAEHARAVSGKFLEVLGFYNPIRKEKKLKKDRIDLWLSRGVQLSPTVHNLFVSENVIKEKKVQAWKPKKRKGEEGEEKKEKKTEGSGVISGVGVEAKADVVKAKAVEVAPEIKSEATPEAKPEEKEVKEEKKEEVKEAANTEVAVETGAETKANEQEK